MPATLTSATIVRTTEAKKEGFAFSELPMWAIIFIDRICYRKQDNGRKDAGLLVHNMNEGGFIKWSDFRQEEERYIQDGAVYRILK